MSLPKDTYSILSHRTELNLKASGWFPIMLHERPISAKLESPSKNSDNSHTRPGLFDITRIPQILHPLLVIFKDIFPCINYKLSSQTNPCKWFCIDKYNVKMHTYNIPVCTNLYKFRYVKSCTFQKCGDLQGLPSTDSHHSYTGNLHQPHVIHQQAKDPKNQ